MFKYIRGLASLILAAIIIVPCLVTVGLMILCVSLITGEYSDQTK